MKLLLVAGARPNFMKIASIVDAIHAHNERTSPGVDYLLVHTGQHYDEKMSHSFFRDLGIPMPAVDLGVGSGSHAAQTADIMKRFEPVVVREQPDVVLVVGDVLAHVEAGLRSGDRTMPEEINRILTDALSDFHFITEASAQEHLLGEGVSKHRIHFVGNTMVDTLLKHRAHAEHSNVLARLGLLREQEDRVDRGPTEAPPRQFKTRRYAVVTLHRPSNVDYPEAFREILDALTLVSAQVPIIFPVHPRTQARIKEFGLGGHIDFSGYESGKPVGRSGIRCVEPFGYLDFLCLTANATLVLTDSGGIQEETTVLGVPCVTMRDNTERPVTVTQGTNVLVGTKKAGIIDGSLQKLHHPGSHRIPEHWDGRAGERIIRILTQHAA
ncbi:MAG: UDP-N-acetylglucosamine 2-epimerase (non-hydrolyzing) [Nitrospirae bacterium]|nr:UDP-N-acetylglucosamine 2-epimerase (non-hydrolyzing) [Nitrospirota bacterium]